MKKVKKLISLTLVLLFVVTLIPTTAGAGFFKEDKTTTVNEDGKWVSAWSTSPISASLNDLGVLDKLGVPVSLVTSRVVIQPTASGSAVRLTFSNEFGNLPLTISACNVAKADPDNHKKVDGSTRVTVTFGGKTRVTIHAGQVITSDPVEINVTAGERLAVTAYYRDINVMRTIGLIGADSYVAVGNQTRINNMLTGIKLKFEADSGSYEIIPALVGVDVMAAKDTDVCVFFGDSTLANEIPRMLAAKLRENGINNVSVTQEAIKGNRLIANGVGATANLLGEAGVDRFQKDVLSQHGVKYVIVKLGINDIVHPYCDSKADKLTPVTFEEMVAGYQQLIDMAHAQGVKIYFCEITPWKGYTRNVFGRGDDVQWTEEIDAIRLQLNEWLENEAPANGFIDLSAMHSADDAYALISDQTPDGIHHNPAGQQNFVNQIPVEMFR